MAVREPKPIRVFYSILSRRFYASSQYKENARGIVTVYGRKYDVTNDIAGLIEEHAIIFERASDDGEDAGGDAQAPT